MINRLTAHIHRNTIGYLALFAALGGTAYAAATIGSADVIDNSLRSVDIGNNQIRAADVRDDSSPGGGLGGADIAAGALTGSDVADDSLGASDIVEASIPGLQRVELFDTGDAYSPGDADTFVELGGFELRSRAGDDEAHLGFRICNTLDPNFGVIGYRGGSSSSTAETRSSTLVFGNSCISFDYNGTGADAFGDFRLVLPNEHAIVQGVGSGTAAQGTVTLFIIED